ncbi:MAG: type II secretion system F family protein [Syntrophorhabdaceae bacterium]|nr:type II secretion system F family protein [Syntrophorhabdaceae bacterium]
MTFKYNALDTTGRSINGTIEADNEQYAKSELKSRGLYIVSIKEVSKKETKNKVLFSFGLKQRLPIILSRQLSSLLKGGVPLFQALTIMANQMEGEKEKEILNYLKDQVRGGTPLSMALKAYPDIFDELFVYSVQAGEKSGALDSILTYQADMLERRAAARGKIKAALTYPAIMAVVGTGVLFFLIGYVVPMVIKIFERMNQALPLSTRILIGMTNLMNEYFYYIILTPFLLFILFRGVRKDPRWKRLWHRLLLNIPGFKNFYIMVLINSFARVLATLLKSGIPMLQSLIAVSGTMKNVIVSEAILKMAEMVEEGLDLSAAMRNTRIFPPYVADMAKVGETGGNLEEMLTNVSEYYEANVNQRITAFTAMVEPVIILLMGAVIAFVLVSILLPLFEMNKILIKR